MGDFSGSKSSVLLPSAKIALFVKDDDLKRVALSLRDDWRFARVTMEVTDGDVETAMSAYASSVSPDLVLVETQEIAEGFAEKLEILGGHCAENTAAIVVGPVNDVYLYRKLIEIGVSDYLVKPLSRDVMADLFSKVLIERLGSENSKLIACMGAKGGVGTSTISHLLADVSANHLGQKTVILDAAGGWSYLSVAMGSESVTTLHEVARASVSSDKDSFNRMIVSVTDKLSFLGTGAEALMDDTISAESFETIVNRLMQTYPVVIVDLSGASIEIRRNNLARANDVIVISTPTLAALRAARGLLSEAKTIRGGKEDGIHIILNKRGIGSGFEVSDKDMELALKLKPSLSLSFLPKIFCAAEGQGKLISSIQGSVNIIKDTKEFLESKLKLTAERGAAVAVPSAPGFLDGFLNKVKKKN